MQNFSSAGAELRAKIFFEGRNDFAAGIADLRFGESCFAALKRDSNEQRILSSGNILAAEKIRRFDGSNFGNIQSANGLGNIGEMCPVGQQQRKIALDARESWQRLVPPRFFRRLNRGVKRGELQLREENVLAQFQFFGDATRKLTGNAEESCAPLRIKK